MVFSLENFASTPYRAEKRNRKESNMKTFVPVVALLSVVEIFGSQELKMIMLGAFALVVLGWQALRNV